MEDLTCAGITKANDTQKQVATQSDREDATKKQKFIRESNPNYGVEEYFVSKKTDQMMKPLIETLVPWAFLAVISIIFWLCFSLCCACDCCCPPCKSCRRDLQTEPYTKGDLRLPMVVLFFFCLIIFGASIPGIMFGSDVESGIKSTRCSLFAGVGDLILGVENRDPLKSWPGLQELDNRLLNLNSHLDDFIKDTNTQFNGANPQQYNDDLTNLLQINSQLDVSLSYTQDAEGPSAPYPSYYTDAKTLQFVCRGTEVSDANIAGELVNLKIVPQEQLLTGMYNGILSSMQGLQKAGEAITSDTKAFQDQLMDGKKKLDKILTDIQTQANDFFDQSEQVDTYGKYITFGSVILFSISLALACLAFVAVFCLGCDYYWARGCIHLTWCIYSIIMILSFILVAVLYPTTGVMVEVCDYVGSMITIRSEMEKQTLITGQSKDLLLQCLFDDGDILKTFNVDEQLAKVNTLGDKLMEFNSVSQEFIQKSDEASQSIQSANTVFLTGFTTIQVVDYKPGQDPKNINYAMRTFTSTQENCKDDLFSATESGCPQGYTYFNDQHQPDTTGKVCLGGYYLLKAHQQTARYDQCITQKTSYQNLLDFFDQQVNKWNPIVATQLSLQAKNDQNQQKLQTYIQQTQAYGQKSTTFINSVTNKQTGLLQGINCQFLQLTVQRFNDAICVKTLPQIWKTQVLLAILACCMFIATTAGYCTAMRYSKLTYTKYLEGKRDENLVQQIQHKPGDDQVIYMSPHQQGQD